ncbi:MAG TPA: iron ABC transporter permease [Lacipirellulaceae bacterium]|nr:iron ABC transporter permease [Lacipirellulaceae bacterium]
MSAALPFIAVAAVVFLLAGVAATLFVGDISVDADTVFQALFHHDANLSQHVIVRDWRLPRGLADVMVGAALAVSGAIMQCVTRNPLASPSIVGLNTGASFTTVVAMVVWPAAGRMDLMLVSIAGATLGAVLVYGIASSSRGGLSPVRLALIGMVISAVLGAIGDGVMIYNELGQDVLLWFARGNENVQWPDIALLFPMVTFGMIGAFALTPSLSVFMLGENVARGLGQRTALTKIAAGVIVLVLTGAAVAVAGPVGFVGLMVPHMVRAVVGFDHRLVIPGSALTGAILMLAADLVAHWATTPFRTAVPVGVVTALMGVPFFLYLACRRSTRLRGDVA